MTDVLPLGEDVPDSLQFGDERIYDYDGDHPVETTISRLTHVGNYSNYGFGELRVKPVTPDERQKTDRKAEFGALRNEQ